MVTFTKLKDAQKFNDEFKAVFAKLGKFEDPINGGAWNKFTAEFRPDLLGQLKIFVAESTAYFDWLDKQLKDAKDHTAAVILNAAELGKKWDDSKYKILKIKKEALESVAAEITKAREGHKAHQGFRLNFTFKQADGAPPDLDKLNTQVTAGRKIFIDKGMAVSDTIDKVRDDYLKRAEAALKMAEKYRDVGQRKIVAAHDDLLELDKKVKDWLNPKAANYKDINAEMARIEEKINFLDGKKKPYPQKDFDAQRPTYNLLKSKITPEKVKLNTDHKMLEILEATLGKEFRDPALLDQTLVKRVMTGFEDAKKKFKTMEKDLTDAYEARVVKIEKKIVG